jgi:hypothetical protein
MFVTGCLRIKSSSKFKLNNSDYTVFTGFCPIACIGNRAKDNKKEKQLINGLQENVREFLIDRTEIF